MIPDHLQGGVISHRNDRMGGRLIAMLNGLRIARDYDLPFHVGWTTGGRTSPEMRDPTSIFDADWVARHFFDSDVMGEIYADLIDLSTLTPEYTERDFRKALAQGASFMSSASIGVVVLPWEDADQVAVSLSQAVDLISFSAPVRQMIDRIDRVFHGKRLTAYHIRRGDIIHDPITSNKLWPNKFIPREFYEQHLTRTLQDSDARVLIFSDTPVEVTRLRAMDRRVQGFDDLLGDTDLTPGARDFLELFAMSRCKRIFGPPSSAFSQTAVTIGGCTLRAVEHALSRQDHSIAMDRMTDRLEDRSDLFINMGDVGQCLHFLIERQKQKGDPARAKRIIEGYLDDGLDKSFAYQLLCELSVATGDLPDCEPVRDRAYARPVYSDDSMAVVNSYSALHHLNEGHLDDATERLHAAFWFRPLDTVVHGGLNIGVGAGCITPQTFYPFDPALTRAKGHVFPRNNETLAPLNAVTPGGQGGAGAVYHMWELVVRDWQLSCGKRLSRAFFNRSKIAKSLDVLARQFKRQDGGAPMTSARGVLLGAIGDLGEATNAQRAAIRRSPDQPLYRKRLSNLLLEQDRPADALSQLRTASRQMGWHPTYQAELAWLLWQQRERDEAWDIVDRLAATPHSFVEVLLMTSDMLRRDTDRTAQALEVVDRALTMGHGAPRPMIAKARLLMTLDRIDEAHEIYAFLIDCGIGSEHTHVDIYRRFAAIGRVDIARDLTARSIYDFDTVRAMADGNQDDRLTA